MSLISRSFNCFAPPELIKASIRLGIRTILLSLHPKQLDKQLGISIVFVCANILTLLRDRLLLALNHST